MTELIDHQKELEALFQHYGNPLVSETVSVGSPTFWESQTNNRSREVCMVILRANSRVLTFTKTFYPKGLYRLLTGGVEFHESVLEALAREVYEETGLQMTPQRLLAVISYRAEHDQESVQASIRFTTFAFLFHQEEEGFPSVVDEQENLLGYGEVAIDDLCKIATELDALPDIYCDQLGTTWKEWGQFRSVIHRTMYQALTSL
ncbi:MAG TPA: NUDIX hydrolase [Ktedonobacteraceae bacterium]|jgi:8-oxo-dGTP pyrophosphatase MutT (NUDIX family)|nr:NUDIX hydrolase [Ktedonobacteraceae bacterium]